MIYKYILLVILLILITCPVYAANCGVSASTYYVDYDSGNDTNNGTATGTPWKHSPGDDNATDNASCSLQADDIVIFKGGVSYVGRIDLDVSGTSGHPITYDGNSAGTWGTGKAIIDGTGTSNYSAFYGAKNYITIRNFEIRDIPYSAAGSAGVWITGAATGVIVRDNYIHELGCWQNSCTTAQISVSAAISMNTPTSATITGNDITKVGNAGVSLQGPTNCTISNNTIHEYVNWGIDISGKAGLSASGNLITQNTIYDIYYYDPPFYTGGGGEPHQNGIFIRRAGDGTYGGPINNTISRNLIYNNYDFAGTSGGTAMIGFSQTDAANLTGPNYVYDNVLINPHSVGILVGQNDHDAGGVQIYNNTIYSDKLAISLQSHTAGYGTANKVKNNIVVGGYLLNIMEGNKTNLEVDYNYYVSTGTLGQAFSEVGGAGYYTFAAWQAANLCGGAACDTHSTLGANVAAIVFANASGYGANSGSTNLSLQSTSPCKDVGTDLSGTFTTDYNGITRATYTPWDIGAYEWITEYTLTLTIAGTGTCTVSSSPSGINSTTSTTYDFNDGTEITLTVSPAGGSTFAGWSGDGGCSGTGTCVLTVDGTNDAATATCNITGGTTGAAAVGTTGSMVMGSEGSITIVP